MKTIEHDYVIVGAGSAGCTLTYRLSADPSIKVLVLEAGGRDYSPWIHIPLGWFRVLQHRMDDWNYFCEPEERLGGRAIECARGKVVGGSSSINAMAYVRGHRGDYDRWAAQGLASWSYQNVLLPRATCSYSHPHAAFYAGRHGDGHQSCPLWHNHRCQSEYWFIHAALWTKSICISINILSEIVVTTISWCSAICIN